MKIKTSELTGKVLDWAVAKCEGYDLQLDDEVSGAWLIPQHGYLHDEKPLSRYTPSTGWSQGGPIIEREFIELRNQTSFSGGWEAWKWSDEKQDYTIIGKRGAYCPTPLIAAMRCYVASKLGDEVYVTDELMET